MESGGDIDQRDSVGATLVSLDLRCSFLLMPYDWLQWCGEKF